MQRLQKLSFPLRILTYVAAAAIIFTVAASIGAVTALMWKSDQSTPGGAKPRQAEEARPAQVDGLEQASGQPSKTEYLSQVGDIQNGAVEASLQSNGKLLRYDSLNSDDVEGMQASYTTLEDYRDQVKALDPPERYEDQYEVFVLAISELYAANELAYRLSADPVSATEDDFDTYDQYIDDATSHLLQSNEILGRHYRTTEAAQDVSLG
jgi:hypothetical protein